MKPRDLGLRSDSFTDDYPDDALPRVIVNIEAYEKVGKTDFSMRDAPDPIIVYNFDQGLEGVIGPLRKKGKEIIVAGVPAKGKNKFPSYHFARPIPNRGESRKDDQYLTRVRKAAVPIWERWIDDMRQGYESDARTMVIDTGGASFVLGKFAFHGMDKVTQKDDPYGQKGGELKAIFQGIVADGFNYDKNVIWVHRLKGEWKGGSPTGGHVLDGYNQMGFEVQATIRLSKDRRGVRSAEVRNSRLRGGRFDGVEFEGGEYSFAHIAAELTKTDVRLWR